MSDGDGSEQARRPGGATPKHLLILLRALRKHADVLHVDDAHSKRELCDALVIVEICLLRVLAEEAQERDEAA